MNTLFADISEMQRARDLLPPCFSGFSMPSALGWARGPQHQAAGCAARERSVPATVSEAPERHEILIVDDNRDAADSLAQLFGVMGAKVSVAYGAQEALVAMTAARPRIAVIDISMPLMNGYELAAQIRACDTFEGVVLIALTGWSPTPDNPSAAATGFDHHLTKPADVQQLARLLESIA